MVWLEFQNCAGCIESMLRAAYPPVSGILLDVINLMYEETIMAAAGDFAERALIETVEEGGHVVIVEGAIPTADDGVYCTIAGRTAIDIYRQATANAAMVMAVGTCASFGGIQAAAPNPTGARAALDIVSTVPHINVPACPPNVTNMTATLVHFLTFGGLPAMDVLHRPLFGFGKRIHDRCERRGHFDAGQFVNSWGDEAHQLGWCLYRMGCKGPQTYQNCPDSRWNQETSWPIQAGHICVGCSEPNFWDTMTPFYRRLPEVPGFGVERTADTIGIALTAATAAGITVHAVGSYIRSRQGPDEEPPPPPAGPPPP